MADFGFYNPSPLSTPPTLALAPIIFVDDQLHSGSNFASTLPPTLSPIYGHNEFVPPARVLAAPESVTLSTTFLVTKNEQERIFLYRLSFQLVIFFQGPFQAASDDVIALSSLDDSVPSEAWISGSIFGP